jgi:hypothetical protein
MALSVLNGLVDELGILRLFRGGEDQRGVCGRILRLVFLDCCCVLAHERMNGLIDLTVEVTGVADNGLSTCQFTLPGTAESVEAYGAGGLELIE